MSNTPDQRRKVRRRLIQLIEKRVTRGSGSDLMALMTEERVKEMWWNEVLDALEGVPCAVVGGVAVSKYAPQRQTTDIDVAIFVPDMRAAESQLKNCGHTYQGPLSIGGSTWKTASGHLFDLISVHAEWAEQAIAEAKGNMLLDMPIIPLPYLVMMKMYSGRPQDVADISRMLGAADDTTLGEVRRVVRRYLNKADLEDLESMVVLGRLEWSAT